MKEGEEKGRGKVGEEKRKGENIKTRYAFTRRGRIMFGDGEKRSGGEGGRCDTEEYV